MENPLLRTEYAIQQCDEFLSQSGAKGTVIEYYLAQYILVSLCSEVQQQVYSITEVKAGLVKPASLARYMKESVRFHVKSANMEKIAAYLNHYGENVKGHFIQGSKGTTAKVFGMAVENRKRVAHENGAKVTLDDVKEAYKAALDVVNIINQALDLAFHDNQTASMQHVES